MHVIADLQLHSKYARAVSPEMVIPKIWEWAKRKGIGLIATGDWTHPLWMREIKTHLSETGNGFLKLKTASRPLGSEDDEGPLFLLATEVSSIYSQGGKVRRVHTLIWSPAIASSDKINQELIKRGANLIADGRPIIGLSSIQVAELVLSIDPSCLIIPAHAWTPWFSLYGSQSGFDSIDECFGPYAQYIYAIETGLSSDPVMNWRIKELDSRSIVSFSDAHSGPKLGREATVFELNELSFSAIREAIMQKTNNKIAYTVEFYPEEGKYHYTGHRACGVKQTPDQTRAKGTTCPVCGKKLTVGVMHRVEELAGRSEEELKIVKKELPGLQMQGMFSEAFPSRPPFVSMVPLTEILAEVLKAPVTGQNVKNEYKKITDTFANEFKILLELSLAEIARASSPRIAEAIGKVRSGNIVVDPGYDGVFGVVKIWSEEKKKEEEAQKEQLSLL